MIKILQMTSLEQLLEKAKVSMDTFIHGLVYSIVTKRKPSDTWINTYNPDVHVWQANMDIQFILDPYACVMYTASYMLKSENLWASCSNKFRRKAVDKKSDPS